MNGASTRRTNGMRCLQVSLSAVSFAVLLAALIACSGVRFQPPTPPRSEPPGPPAGPPVVVSPQQLAQEFAEDRGGDVFARWTHKVLQVEGVIGGHPRPVGPAAPGDRRIHGVVFKAPVTDK